MQALDSLADLMRKPNHGFESSSTKSAGWDRVWTIWHYAALSLTQQEALLTSGIVEYSLPNAVSTCWELNKPRSKQHRDVHKDRKQHGEHFAPHVPVLEELYPWIRDYFKRVCDMPNS
ncbi:early growth response protein 1 [Colletotrichum tofieldiae]|uniref:Early growth response protein 1 (Egr-1) n=1 Tax=Colletotrichum tofieldiae TaxID=708197 RepID=A0A166YIL8_9PEZI|nr:early growth response protein 1 (egr-1) [Colletotrichum tofieldiae]GKT69009.1 early growth response protein 1 [Colletotrichum tofieldiae]